MTQTGIDVNSTRLTDDEMEKLTTGCELVMPAEFILLVYKTMDPTFEANESVNPATYKLPKSQAKALLDSFIDRTGSSDILLLWLNSGPGCYDD